MNFRADTVVQRSCTRDTAGEIRVYRSSFRGIYAPLSFAAHFAALLLLLSREGKGREESARVQKFHEDDCDYRPLRYRSDLEGNKDRERERVLLEDFRLDFILRRKGIERGRLEPLSFLRAVQLLSRWLRFSSSWKRERERWWLLLVSSRRARVGIARKRVGEEEGSRSLEERRVSAQRGVVRSARLGRWVARIAVAVGEAKKGKELGKGRRKSTGAVITTLRRDVSAALGRDACVHARHCKITASKTITLQANSSRGQPWTMRTTKPAEMFRPPVVFSFDPLLLEKERASTRCTPSMPTFSTLLQFLRSTAKRRKGKSDNSWEEE